MINPCRLEQLTTRNALVHLCGLGLFKMTKNTKKATKDKYYNYELKYGSNWFMNLLAKHIGLKIMGKLGIVRL